MPWPAVVYAEFLITRILRLGMHSSTFRLLALITILAAACRGTPEGPPMLLVVHEPPDHQAKLVAADPDSSVLEHTIRSLSWSDITFVVLKADDRNWIEGSGSLNSADGLSARYMLDGEEHIAARAPSSLDELLTLLQSYRRGDGRWLELIEWD